MEALKKKGTEYLNQLLLLLIGVEQRGTAHGLALGCQETTTKATIFLLWSKLDLEAF